MKGRPDMYSGMKKKYNTKALIEFIINQIEEHESMLSETLQKKSEYNNKIRENEAFIRNLEEIKNENANIFSPNSKDYSTKDYDIQLESIKTKLRELVSNEQELRDSIKYLTEIKNVLTNHEPFDLNRGINILEIQEQDRQRIARDLHDSTVQNLTSLIHKCELCMHLVDIDSIRTKLELSTMSNTLKAVINEIREIIYDLKPMSLDDLGLLTTIERYINQIMMNHDIKVKVKHNDERQDVLPVIKLSIFRIVQEACNNAIKHADAKNIDIDIIYKEKYISLSIRDDGRGFDAECRRSSETADLSGYGLSIMRERVNLLSGTMAIQSTINKGTIITITIPITKSEGEM